MPDDPWKNPFENLRIEVDPQRLDEMTRNLRAKLDELRGRVADGVEFGRYTKVRLSYRGKQVGPDIPLAALLAGEGVALMALGPLWAVLGNLGAKAMLEIEVLHESDELVTRGNELYMAGETDAAERCYRQALERRRDDPTALYHLGVLLRVTGRTDEALSALRKAAMGPEGHADVARAAELLQRMEGKRRL
ncbi:MAG TPA: tetratricopeptide repeat protein [Myxococcota bacterium]|nr:tetratricopeptide repeat protein [Myxococcota bacterium]